MVQLIALPARWMIEANCYSCRVYPAGEPTYSVGRQCRVAGACDVLRGAQSTTWQILLVAVMAAKTPWGSYS